MTGFSEVERYVLTIIKRFIIISVKVRTSSASMASFCTEEPHLNRGKIHVYLTGTRTKIITVVKRRVQTMHLGDIVGIYCRVLMEISS